MQGSNDTSQQKFLVPTGLVEIGTVRLGEEPRTSTFLSKAVLVGGYVASFFGSLFAREFASIVFKEDTSAYAFVAKSSFWDGVKKGLSRTFDPKLWKSNVADWATLIGGIFLTQFVVRKIEEATFKERHGSLPRDQVERMLHGHTPTANHLTDKTTIVDVEHQGMVDSVLKDKSLA